MDESNLVPKAESLFASSVLIPMGIKINKPAGLTRLNEVIDEFNETYLETMDFLTQILPLAREQFGRIFCRESDVVRVFNPSVRMSRVQLRALLAKADLVSAGFTKTEETQIVTGENGEKITKEVTYYTVQDACSNVSYWEEIIRDRLPTFSAKLTRKVIDEVEERISNRATEYCRFGLEIHFQLCSHAEKKKPAKRVLRRGPRLPPPIQTQPAPAPPTTCTHICIFCWKVAIKYMSVNL
ncbi:Hypothetical predicted protein [Paramuricea clavata]|uniref:Uncharacterized protein n=1 Tax=Paramuricea clavata TaxID=317549 RepID=A0A7D9LG85_PARCT|nr:Hypothetical predicted protein [Paramuricea clavata]